MSIPEIIILTLFFALLYIFILYPILLWIFSKIFKKPLKIDINFKPLVTFIISAYNEEKYIKAAIESIISSGYPSNLIRIIVGSDGSTDNTATIVKELQNKYDGISLYEFERSGKNYVLNQLVLKADTEIIMFMDADLRINKGILDDCLNKFSNSSIGCVMCSLNIIQQNNNNNIGTFGEILYQKLETKIRHYESLINSNVNSLGTLYGIRKQYFINFPNDLVCDDFFTILSIAKHKKRVFFDQLLEVIEIREKSLKGEIKRRVRLVAGGLSTIWKMKRLLLPDYGWTTFFLISHKLIRYLSPLFLITFIVIMLLMNQDSFLFKPLVYSQLFLYITATLGYLLEKINIRFFLFRISVFFISMNIGFLLGIFRFLKQGQNSKWDRVDAN